MGKSRVNSSAARQMFNATLAETTKFDVKNVTAELQKLALQVTAGKPATLAQFAASFEKQAANIVAAHVRREQIEEITKSLTEHALLVYYKG